MPPPDPAILTEVVAGILARPPKVDPTDQHKPKFRIRLKASPQSGVPPHAETFLNGNTSGLHYIGSDFCVIALGGQASTLPASKPVAIDGSGAGSYHADKLYHEFIRPANQGCLCRRTSDVCMQM